MKARKRKRPNPAAKALAEGQFRRKIIPNKKRKRQREFAEQQAREAANDG